MTKLGKLWRLALGVVVLLIAAQGVVSLLVRTRRMHGYLIARLERAFGRPVEVGHFAAQILPTPQLDAVGVTIGEDPAFGYEYFLRAERLAASLRWTGLLRGQFEFGTLSLSRPSLILIRNREEKWNLERWLPPAKANAAESARVYGPQMAAAPVNHLRKIEFDDGRINFKNAEEKLPFAFTSVTGSVEQVVPGRWQLRLEAQPWRSGVALQSTGIVGVRGDIAGTSARLQPAEISVHWDKVSLADLFRLFSGQDYGVRGEFALDATARSAAPASATGLKEASVASQPGDWTYALQARSARIHRWDLTERDDNPRVNVSLKGRWNAAAGTASADEMKMELPKSNLQGLAKFSSVAAPEWELHVDSAGIQAADLLAWGRAFHPDIDQGLTAEQFFTGAMTLRAWPLMLQEAAFSSAGGEIRIPLWSEPLKVSSIAGGLTRTRFSVEPVVILLPAKKSPASVPARREEVAGKRKAAPAIVNEIAIAFKHDFSTRAGELSINGYLEKIEDLLKVTAAFGRPVNHGWELTGGALSDLHWIWTSSPLRGRWNGKVDLTKAQLQAAGLNQPLRLDEVKLQWKDGKRGAEIGRVEGFGATWSGVIAEPNLPVEDDTPKWNFKLHADHLDAAELDRWAGPRARPGWLERLLPSLLGNTTQNASPSELLRRVNAEGELRVDELTVEKLQLEHVRAQMAVRELQLDVQEMEAQWAGGKVRGKMHAAFLPRPKYDVVAELDRVDVSQMPSATLAERFAGVASGTVQLTTNGVGRDELLENLSGKGEVRLKNVEFRGWDMAASLEDGTPRTGTSRWPTGEGAFSVRERNVVLDGLQLGEPHGRMTVRGTASFARIADLTIEPANVGKRETRTTRVDHALKIRGLLDAPQVTVESAKNSHLAD